MSILEQPTKITDHNLYDILQSYFEHC